MKRILLASLAGLALTSGSALAADLYRPAPVYKAPPPPAPAVSWTGCYIDGGVGYGMWNQDHYTETEPGLAQLTVSSTNGGRGWLGRVGAGCDYQVASSFVIGAFGDYDFMDLTGTNEATFPPGTLAALGHTWSGNEKESGAWAVGGRIGYLVTPSLLTYFDGGYTQARFDQINFFGAAIPSTALTDVLPQRTYHGWFIGGGEEYALGSIIPISGLFWRTEYRYASYQNADVTIVDTAIPGPIPFAEHVQKDVQTITSGLVWRFNFGGH